MRHLIIVTIALMFFSCHTSKRDNNTTKEQQNKKKLITINKEVVIKIPYKQVYSMKTVKGDNLGDVFVKSLPEDTHVFTSLVISNNTIGDIDTLYFITDNILRNKNGIEAEVQKSNFYGYRFVKKKQITLF